MKDCDGNDPSLRSEVKLYFTCVRHVDRIYDETMKIDPDERNTY